MTTAISSFGPAASACFLSTQIGTTISVDTISSAFPTCNAIFSSYAVCSSTPPQSTSLYDDCLCNQDFLNGLYGCQNEWRICLDSESGDHNAQSAIENWHSECDSITMVTTPPLSSLSTTAAPPQACESLNAACASVGQLGNGCLEQYPAVSQSVGYSSCVCQQNVLSLASVCGYDGNRTCLGVSATLSDIPVWKYCPMQVSSFLAEQGAQSTLPDVTFTPASTTAMMTGGQTIPPRTSTGLPTSTASGVAGVHRVSDQQSSLALVALGVVGWVLG